MNRNEEGQRYPGVGEGIEFRIRAAWSVLWRFPFGSGATQTNSCCPGPSQARMRMAFARMHAIQGLRSALSALSTTTV